MLKKTHELVLKVKNFTPKSEEELNKFRIKYLGKKGLLNDLFSSFKEIPNEQKKEFGSSINNLKKLVQEKIKSYKDSFNDEELDNEIDLTKPSSLNNLGSRHPISLIRNQIVGIFNTVGFTVSDGPEIEDDWHNFSALNLPEEHPARDMQDTFFIQTDPDVLLRTHTSSVQVRYMENNTPPIKTLSPGRVTRNAEAHCIFHQVEGLYIDENVFADKTTLCTFPKNVWRGNKIRFRPRIFLFWNLLRTRYILLKMSLIIKLQGIMVEFWVGW